MQKNKTQLLASFKHPCEYTDEELHKIVVTGGFAMSLDEYILFCEECIHRDHNWIDQADEEKKLR